MIDIKVEKSGSGISVYMVMDGQQLNAESISRLDALELAIAFTQASEMLLAKITMVTTH